MFCNGKKWREIAAFFVQSFRSLFLIIIHNGMLLIHCLILYNMLIYNNYYAIAMSLSARISSFSVSYRLTKVLTNMTKLFIFAVPDRRYFVNKE